MQRAATASTRIADKVLMTNCGFAQSQFKLLWVLYRHEPGVAQKTIAFWLNQTEAAISRQVHILKKLGLVESYRDGDKRTNKIMLTPEGREFTETATATLVEAYAPEMDVLSATEQEVLAGLLDRLNERLCNKKNI